MSTAILTESRESETELLLEASVALKSPSPRQAVLRYPTLSALASRGTVFPNFYQEVLQAEVDRLYPTATQSPSPANYDIMYAIQVKLNAFQPNTDPALLRLALLVEIGELAQEVGGEWKWWKKSPTPPTETPYQWRTVLDECVDIWHFALSRHQLEPSQNYLEPIFYRRSWRETLGEPPSLIRLFDTLGDTDPENHYLGVNALISYLRGRGYTRAEFELAYLRKAAINLLRWGKTPLEIHTLLGQAA